MRAVAPATRLTSRDGTPTAVAISFTSAALASPLLGVARTLILSTARPSDRVSMPSITSRPPPGAMRTGRDAVGSTPAALGRRADGKAHAARTRRPRRARHQSEDIRIDVPDD